MSCLLGGGEKVSIFLRGGGGLHKKRALRFSKEGVAVGGIRSAEKIFYRTGEGKKARPEGSRGVRRKN